MAMETIADAMERATVRLGFVDATMTDSMVTEESLRIDQLKKEFAEKVVSSGFDLNPPYLGGIMARMSLGVNRRGWIMRGSTGSGKTTAADWCRWGANRGKPERERIRLVPATELYDSICDLIQRESYTSEQKREVFGLTHGSGMHEHGLDLIIDDLGAEPRKTIFFGREVFPMQELIMKRYAAFPSVKTYITTNLSMDEIAECYGERVKSRILEMCELMTIDGDDYRARNAKKK